MSGEPATPAAPTRPRSAAPAALLASLFVAALGLVAWGFALRLPLTGADAWPLLDQASRALEDPGVLWRERYLEGVPFGGHFWRPLFVGAFSLQWAAFGVRPLPYHVVRLIAYLLTALLAGALARRRGSAPVLTSVVAGAIVLLHPVQADMVPSVARSADVLNDLLLAATILCLARASARRERLLPLFAGVACSLLAPGVKETGLAAPVIALLLLEPWSSRSNPTRRAAAAVLVVGLGLNALVRLALLGSLGSYVERPGRDADAESNAVLIVEALTDQRSTWVAALVLALFVVAILCTVRARGTAPEAGPDWRLVRRGAWAWLLVAGLGALASPRLADRHAAAMLVPAAVLIAASAGGLARRGEPSSSSSAAVARIALGAALFVVLAPRSPLWRTWPQWELIGETSELVIEAADAAARELAVTGRPAEVRCGELRVVAELREKRPVVSIVPFPFQAAPPTGPRAAALHQPVVLMPYSVRAALRLRGQPARVQVLAGRGILVAPEHLGPPSAPRPVGANR